MKPNRAGSWVIERGWVRQIPEKAMNLTKSQIQALSIIVREGGASRAQLIEEGVHQRCLFSLVDNELVDLGPCSGLECKFECCRLLVLEDTITGTRRTLHVCGVHAATQFPHDVVVETHIGDPDAPCDLAAVRKTEPAFYTLTELGTATCVEHKIVAAPAWTKGPNPKPTGLEKYLEHADTEEVIAVAKATNVASAMLEPRNGTSDMARGPTRPRIGTKGATRSMKPEPTLQDCLCGCKAQVKGSFAMGHDARLHGQVVRAKKENAQVLVSERAAAWLMTKPWAVDGYKVEA